MYVEANNHIQFLVIDNVAADVVVTVKRPQPPPNSRQPMRPHMNPNAKKPQRKVYCFILRLLATVHVFCCYFSGIETLFGISAISFMKVQVLS